MKSSGKSYRSHTGIVMGGRHRLCTGWIKLILIVAGCGHVSCLLNGMSGLWPDVVRILGHDQKVGL